MWFKFFDRQSAPPPGRRRGELFGSTLAAVALLTLSLSGCGGGDSDANEEIASLDDGSGSNGSTPSSDGTGEGDPQDTQEAALEFAQCLRDEGLDVDDPTFDAEGNIDSSFAGGLDFGSEKMQAAMDACQDLLGSFRNQQGGGTGDLDQVNVMLADFTDCLRQEGLEVGDVDLDQMRGGGGGPPSGQSGGADPAARIAEMLGVDPEAPDVKPALDACGDILSFGGQRGDG